MKKLEIRRHIGHFLWGLLFFLLVYFDLINFIIMFILIVLLFLGSLLSKKIKVPIGSWLIKIFDRPKDIKTLPAKGGLYFLIGIFFVMLFFPKDIVLASIIILTIGDGVSFFVGKKYGKIEHPFSKKHFIEGTLVGAFFSFIVASFFIIYYEAAIAAFISVFVGDSDTNLNDNAVIPIVAGVIIWLLRLII